MQSNNSRQLIELEKKFWQSLVDDDADTAIGMLAEPALMVSAHGAMKFDHAAYRKMAEEGTNVLTSYELGDMEVMFPTDDTAILTYRVKQSMGPRGQKSGGPMEEMADSSTWIRQDGEWRCVMHTETPVDAQQAGKHH